MYKTILNFFKNNWWAFSALGIFLGSLAGSYWAWNRDNTLFKLTQEAHAVELQAHNVQIEAHTLQINDASKTLALLPILDKKVDRLEHKIDKVQEYLIKER